MKQSKEVWKLINATCIYVALQVVFGAIIPNLFLAMSLSGILIMLLFVVLRLVDKADFKCPYAHSGLLRIAVNVSFLSFVCLFPSMFLQEKLDIDASKLEQTLQNLFDCVPLSFFCICVVTPVVEEMMFRGVIYSVFLSLIEKRFGVQRNLFGGVKISAYWQAIFLTSLLFALIHGELAQMPHAFLVGMLLGWLRRKFSLTMSVLYHVINNSAVYFIAYLYGEEKSFSDIVQNVPSAVVVFSALTLILLCNIISLSKSLE